MQVATVTVVGSEMKKVRKFPGLLQITWSFFFGLGLVQLLNLNTYVANMKT